MYTLMYTLMYTNKNESYLDVSFQFLCERYVNNTHIQEITQKREYIPTNFICKNQLLNFFHKF